MYLNKHRENVLKPTIRFSDLDDWLQKLEDEVAPKAEAKLEQDREGTYHDRHVT